MWCTIEKEMSGKWECKIANVFAKCVLNMEGELNLGILVVLQAQDHATA